MKSRWTLLDVGFAVAMTALALSPLLGLLLLVLVY